MTNKKTVKKTSNKWVEVARFIYEATRIEAGWSKRSIVPEAWEHRDENFRKQFVNIIETYLEKDKLPIPEEAHDSWTRAYEKMGWKYGKKRDVVRKTHPDMLPFSELPKDERDKDAIFLAFVWIAKKLIIKSQQKTLEWVLKEVVGEDEVIPRLGSNNLSVAIAKNELRQQIRQIIKNRMEEENEK